MQVANPSATSRDVMSNGERVGSWGFCETSHCQTTRLTTSLSSNSSRGYGRLHIVRALSAKEVSLPSHPSTLRIANMCHSTRIRAHAQVYSSVCAAPGTVCRNPTHSLGASVVSRHCRYHACRRVVGGRACSTAKYPGEALCRERECLQWVGCWRD